MSVFYEWSDEQKQVSVDMAIRTELLLGEVFLFKTVDTNCQTGSSIYLGQITEKGSLNPEAYYYCELTQLEYWIGKRLEVEPLDFYEKALLAPGFRKHYDSYFYVWCEIVKETGAFNFPVICQIQHFFRQEYGFDRKQFELELSNLSSVEIFEEPEGTVVNTVFVYSEASLLETVAISFVAAQRSGYAYRGWEVNVEEIKSLIG